VSYRLRCECGEVVTVESLFDFSHACKPKVSSSWDVTEGQVIAQVPDVVLRYADGLERVLPGPVLSTQVFEPTDDGGKRLFERIKERDEQGRRIFLEKVPTTTVYVGKAAEEWRQYERDRLRAAMRGMANVMACVVRAFANQDQHVAAFAKRQRETRGYGPDWPEHVRTEWSRRVREGVAKLQPPGPRVYCASEEDI
jgi:hypothetical protein